MISAQAEETPAPPPTAPVETPTTATPAAVPPTPPAGTRAMVVDIQSIDAIIGKAVHSTTGDDLGRLIDVLVGSDGKIRAAVIDFGGVLGVGSRKVAVDWPTLDFSKSMKGGTIILALTRNDIRVSPEYRAGEPVVILEKSKPADAEAAKAPAASPTSPPGEK